MFHILFALAVAPCVFFLWFFYSRDKYEKEPLRKVFSTYLLGMISVIPAIILSELGSIIFPFSTGIFSIIVYFFLVVALSEEICKLTAVIPAFRSFEFNEVMDGIVYGASAALGFATVENIFYVLQGGVATGILRAILSVPGHALDGVVIGYFLGLAKFNKSKRTRLILTGLTLSVILHGFWDLFSFVGLTIGVIGIYIIGWILFFRYRRSALKASVFRSKYCLYCGAALKKDDLYCLKCGEEQLRA